MQIYFPRKNGFTLVELLVVITIIGILIALLLPAVQAAREAARRMQCQNNLKQIGLAVLNYESQCKIFPPSSCWPSSLFDPRNASLTDYRANWVIFILPFLDQQSLFDKFDLNAAISGNTSTANRLARATTIPTMLCPTDAQRNRIAFMGNTYPATSAFGDSWARGNYAANASLGFMCYTASGATTPSSVRYAAFPGSLGWKAGYVRGVMGANCAVKMADVIDGTSNTCMLAEIRAGATAGDPRGVWALSGGSSALWGHGRLDAVGGDDYGPNSLASIGADDVVGGDNVNADFGGGNSLLAEGMPCIGEPTGFEQTARSLHPDGVSTCFCDGSVHWISDFIQLSPSTAASLSVWDRLMASADGQPVSGNAF
jgi:prepilin-type N-terminal cleavage/methylation domain-containing protein